MKVRSRVGVMVAKYGSVVFHTRLELCMRMGDSIGLKGGNEGVGSVCLVSTNA